LIEKPGDSINKQQLTAASESIEPGPSLGEQASLFFPFTATLIEIV
jgi:hypothetical protein